MFLAIDIGNTNITLGVYEGERLRATWRPIWRTSSRCGSCVMNVF